MKHIPKRLDQSEKVAAGNLSNLTYYVCYSEHNPDQYVAYVNIDHFKDCDARKQLAIEESLYTLGFTSDGKNLSDDDWGKTKRRLKNETEQEVSLGVANAVEHHTLASLADIIDSGDVKHFVFNQEGIDRLVAAGVKSPVLEAAASPGLSKGHHRR